MAGELRDKVLGEIAEAERLHEQLYGPGVGAQMLVPGMAPPPEAGEFRYAVASRHSAFSIAAAIDRAAYHLRREGNGPADDRVADILESIAVRKEQG